jgi:hypothetical protein
MQPAQPFSAGTKRKLAVLFAQASNEASPQTDEMYVVDS